MQSKISRRETWGIPGAPARADLRRFLGVLLGMKITPLRGRSEGVANAHSLPWLTAGACGSMAMHISFGEPPMGSATKGGRLSQTKHNNAAHQTSGRQGTMIGLP